MSDTICTWHIHLIKRRRRGFEVGSGVRTVSRAYSLSRLLVVSILSLDGGVFRLLDALVFREISLGGWLVFSLLENHKFNIVLGNFQDFNNILFGLLDG